MLIASDQRSNELRDFVSREIKWTSELEHHLDRGTELRFVPDCLRTHAYRPYTKLTIYYARALTHRTYQQDSIYPLVGPWDNVAIGFTGLSSSKPFHALGVDRLPSYDFLEKTQFTPLWRYEGGRRVNNITDWALGHFKNHYQPGRGKKDRPITKEGIFHYVYGILHDPVYRDKYAQNLKREFPRVPLYPDFWQWADWGKALMGLHIGYEQVAPFPLDRTDVPDDRARRASQSPKALLRANKESGSIVLDSETTLAGIPSEAWDYKLGNRSALEWILDQYKEKKPRDPTIREKFNTYRFADYKDKVIDLLGRVTTVSVETVKIVGLMKQANR